MADKKPNRLPVDFHHMKPDNIEITDPVGAEGVAAGVPIDREYPKHVHKHAPGAAMHEYVTVNDAKEEADARKRGFGTIAEANKAKELEADAVPSDPAAAPAAPKAAKAPRAKKQKAGA